MSQSTRGSCFTLAGVALRVPTKQDSTTKPKQWHGYCYEYIDSFINVIDFFDSTQAKTRHGTLRFFHRRQTGQPTERARPDVGAVDHIFSQAN